MNLSKVMRQIMKAETSLDTKAMKPENYKNEKSKEDKEGSV